MKIKELKDSDPTGYQRKLTFSKTQKWDVFDISANDEEYTTLINWFRNNDVRYIISIVPGRDYETFGMPDSTRFRKQFIIE